MEFDVQQFDKYGRILAYIYLEDGTFVNAWLVENGYAVVMTVPPNVKHQDLFLKLQREAREREGSATREKKQKGTPHVGALLLFLV